MSEMLTKEGLVVGLIVKPSEQEKKEEPVKQVEKIEKPKRIKPVKK